MNDTLVDYLDELEPTDENIEAATRSLVSELTDDLVPRQMLDQLVAAVDNTAALDGELLELGQSPKARRELCLAFLAWAWQHPSHRDRVRKALEGTRRKMPVIELSILALTAMYGMYLIVVSEKGPEVVQEIEQKDGHYKFRTQVKPTVPSSPIGVIQRFFGGLVAARGKPVDEGPPPPPELPPDSRDT